MPKVSETFPSTGGDWLKVEDLQQKARKVVIEGVESIQVRDFTNPEVKKPKLCISLQGTDKLYVANVTSARDIAAAYGDDTDDWIGKPIILKPKLWDNGKWGIVGEAIYEVDESPPVSNPVPSAIKELADKFDASEDDSIPF